MADDDVDSRMYNTMGWSYAIAAAAILAGVSWGTFAVGSVMSFGLSYWHRNRQA